MTVIPSRRECMDLLHKINMPLHIQKHSLMVAEIALYLGCRLNTVGTGLNLELIQAGGLLHDIAKPQSLLTGERHDDLGAQMVLEWGYASLAPTVQNHVTMDLDRATGPITEDLLVNYADKRVKHDLIVTLEERFDDLIVRYAKTAEHRIHMKERLDLYLILEGRIFEHLDIAPADAELMLLSPEFEPQSESEDYEQEIDCGFIGRR